MSALDWDEELTEEQREQLIEKLAERVQRYRLAVPAILALEMHKPFAFLASQAIIVGSGFLAPIFGLQNVQRYSKLFEKSENVERLIRRIEALAALPESDLSRPKSSTERPPVEPQGGGVMPL